MHTTWNGKPARRADTKLSVIIISHDSVKPCHSQGVAGSQHEPPRANLVRGSLNRGPKQVWNLQPAMEVPTNRHMGVSARFRAVLPSLVTRFTPTHTNRIHKMIRRSHVKSKVPRPALDNPTFPALHVPHDIAVKSEEWSCGDRIHAHAHSHVSWRPLLVHSPARSITRAVP
jgi:hypothetical protein